MEFTHYDLGNVKRGQIIEIKLEGSAANIRLMSQKNYMLYVKKSRYIYIGGLATKSPTHLRIPNDGHWHVVIDMLGLKGIVKTGFRLLSGNTKTLKVEYIYDCVTSKNFMPKKDVFVAYAGADLDTIVHPLTEALGANGLKVWPNKLEISANTSLQGVVEKGLYDSWIGVIVLSRAIIANDSGSDNTNIITKNQRGEELIVLVRHDITLKEIGSFYPSLFSTPSFSTSEHSPENIADKITRKLNNNKLFYI